jgi:hypothetical protein
MVLGAEAAQIGLVEARSAISKLMDVVHFGGSRAAPWPSAAWMMPELPVTQRSPLACGAMLAILAHNATRIL